MKQPEQPKQALPVIELGAKFEAGPYRFAMDLDTFFDQSLQVNGEASIVGDVLGRLRREKVAKALGGWRGEMELTTESGTINVQGDRNVVNTLYRLAELLQQGADPVNATFYYYGRDSVMDSPQEAFEFFVVQNAEIACERFALFTDDIRVLNEHRNDDPIWHSHSHLDEASTIYWYRKFYQETHLGQLTVLRPDNPTLYHMPRTGDDKLLKDWMIANRNLTILFWVGVVLLGLGWVLLVPEHTFLSAALLVLGLLALDKLNRIHAACATSTLAGFSKPLS